MFINIHFYAFQKTVDNSFGDEHNVIIFRQTCRRESYSNSYYDQQYINYAIFELAIKKVGVFFPTKVGFFFPRIGKLAMGEINRFAGRFIVRNSL